MPDADRRIFDYFSRNAETAEEVDYLAYASYAFSKFEWFQKYLEQNGREPTQAEADKWIDELPDSRLDEIHSAASRVFRSAARAYMADPMREAQRKAVLESINTEIRRHNQSIEATVTSATSFKANFWPNVGLSILSSFIFSLVLIVSSVIVTKDPSPIALLRGLFSGVPGPAAPDAPAVQAAPGR